MDCKDELISIEIEAILDWIEVKANGRKPEMIEGAGIRIGVLVEKEDYGIEKREKIDRIEVVTI